MDAVGACGGKLISRCRRPMVTLHVPRLMVAQGNYKIVKLSSEDSKMLRGEEWGNAESNGKVKDYQR